ncbi:MULTISPECIES: MarR family winged helix-turn-helix transcriptional regulator [Ureibacillus]|uniref:DNA-binding MarR family transcriptional regulator n=1 Tax=Ureibacillus thermosphaericus TaxID=51173 RepID=A0A840Q123_URETH|nr:MarR family transcriptional regulator [Ureibacillus thermosphaericus]MBB5150168.1 DNA-binding MarR family transcriptional regulator [Ureibacillus thermosphaericus]NKZ32247.1 MarR family transcriptional regulator [Ureibacillus thermosphaericus]
MEGFFQHYLRLYRPLINALNELLSEYNLSYSLWQVIYYIKHNGPSTLVEIAKRYSVEKPSITRRVNALEELRLIEKRESRDRREKVIQLTPLGEEIYASCRKKISSFERKMMEHLTEDELQNFFHTLSKIQQQFYSKEGKQQ